MNIALTRVPRLKMRASLKDDKIFAFVPLNNNFKSELLQMTESPIHLLFKIDSVKGLMICMPLSYVLLTSINKELKAQEDFIKVLVEQLELLESVKQDELGINIIVKLSRYRIRDNLHKFKKVLGTLLTGITVSIFAFILNKSLVLLDEKETYKNNNHDF
jgi:hypothetical protein